MLWEFPGYILTSNGRIREGYLEEIAADLDLYRWHLDWQGRKGTLGGGTHSKGLVVGRCVPARETKTGVLLLEHRECQEM